MDSTRKTHLLSINFNIRHIVFKDSWNVDFWELILTEDNQEARLTTSTVPNNHQLLTNGSHCSCNNTSLELQIRFQLPPTQDPNS